MQLLPKHLIVCMCIAMAATFAHAQNTKFTQVTVAVQSFDDIQMLADLGFDIDHYQGSLEEGIRFFVTTPYLQKLKSLPFNFEITIPDYNSYYEQLQAADRAATPNPSKSPMTADGFGLGSMGGFYTFSEIEAKLDEMKAKYPNLITAKSAIGTSVEGRPIWMVKISDNPTVNENEPVAYFDALHHAREPLSMASTLNYMFWLLENYATNPQVKYLVDHREIYFVPVVNPDGYAYNETTNPNGGGLWRKNRRPIDGTCVGVDLNRNYGFAFGINDACSSPNPCSGIYRGEQAFSEPETVAIRDFLATIEPETAFSTHSTAGTYLMPYGFDTSPPAYDIYAEWASAFLAENNYTYGVTFQMLGYTSCGTTRDYLHSEGIYGWTPEIGGQGFWPPQSTIFDLVAENVRPFYYQTQISGAYLDVQSHRIIGDVVPGEPFQLAVEIKNVGLGDTTNSVSVIVQANATDIISPTASTFGNVLAREVVSNQDQPFQFFVEPTFADGFFTITITTTQDGVVNETLEIPVYVGAKDVLFHDDAESGATNWSATGTGIAWGTNTDDSYSGTSSFGDSTNGNSANDTNNVFQLNEVFNFTDSAGPSVQFASKHAMEEGDVTRFQISADDGKNWITLKEYSRNEPWRIQSFDLYEYVGMEQIRFRFTMTTDGAIPGDGFYFDDFEVSNYNDGILDISIREPGTPLTIYPNPFTDSVYIKSSETLEFSEIALYDSSGKKLVPTLEKSNELWVLSKVSALAKGMYVLILKDADTGQQWVQRLVKN